LILESAVTVDAFLSDSCNLFPLPGVYPFLPRAVSCFFH
jgi:hypothetical protein